MGCTSSQPRESDKAAAARKKAERDAANAAMNAPKPDPANFMLCKLKDQTIVKEPGSIRGQQFIIEECENCTIYLLDYSATVSIDECKNCRIFVGPCESSVFVRTSKHLKLIIAAQQLRTRECSDLDILLYVSAGQPVIESTSNVRLGCFDFNYFGLAEQFAAAKLDPWYSEWSNVHDFTAQAGRQAWEYIQPARIRGTELLPPLDQAKEGLSQLDGFVTPHTWGNRPAPVPAGSPRMLLLLAPGSHDAGFELLEQTLKAQLDSDHAFLIRTRVVDLSRSKDTQNAVFVGEARKRQAAFVSGVTAKDAPKGGVLGMELLVAQEHLAEVMALLQPFAQKLGNKMYISDSSEAESRGPLDAFFANAPVIIPLSLLLVVLAQCAMSSTTSLLHAGTAPHAHTAAKVGAGSLQGDTEPESCHYGAMGAQGDDVRVSLLNDKIDGGAEQAACSAPAADDDGEEIVCRVKKYTWRPPVGGENHAYKPHQGEGSQYLRDFILGVNDGIISTFLLVVGIQAGGGTTKACLLGGIASAVAGAISMGLGEYIATKSQTNVTKGEFALEKEHFQYHRDVELEQLRGFLNDVGLRGNLLEAVVSTVGRDDDHLMKMMQAFEFGAGNDDIERNPLVAMYTSGRLFLLGSIPTVLPFFFVDSTLQGLWISSILVGCTLFFVGAYKTRSTRGNPVWEGLENLLLGAIGAALSYGVGTLFDHYY